MAQEGKKRGVLLVNLGSPQSTEVADVRRYLDEFLSDPCVLDIPGWKRWLLLKLVILPRRPARTAEAYRKIWTVEGSPLIVSSRRLEQAVSDRVDEPVALGMRYGKPSIAEALEQLVVDGVDDVFVIPLYPHYAMSSYETVVKKVEEEAIRQARPLTLSFQKPFYDDPGYIDTLSQVAGGFLQESYDHLLFSFHGVPVRHIEKGDPSRECCLKTDNCCFTDSVATATCYRSQCLRTARALVESLQVEEGRWSVAFQSRLGRDPWLEPFTDHELERLPQAGKRNIAVICPSFVSDCLETLEEIEMEGKQSFLAAGGDSFTYIPCLNEHPRWVDLLCGFIENAPQARVRADG